MLAADRDALICDMAETYQVFDIRSVPLPLLATLASGLGMDSRIRLRQYGLKASWQTVLLATLLDGWIPNRGTPFTDMFVDKRKADKKSDSKVFASIEEFEAARAKVTGGHQHG